MQRAPLRLVLCPPQHPTVPWACQSVCLGQDSPRSPWLSSWAVFPLGKANRHSPFSKTSRMSHKWNELAFWGGEWKSGLKGGQRAECTAGSVQGPGDAQAPAPAWHLSSLASRTPAHCKGCYPPWKKVLACWVAGKIHSQGDRWLGKKQSGIRERVWEGKCGLGKELEEERTGISVRRQMTECCLGRAVGGGKGNGSNVFMHKGSIIISTIPLLSTPWVPLGWDVGRQQSALQSPRKQGSQVIPTSFYFWSKQIRTELICVQLRAI